MRYPRLSADARLTMGITPSAVVCTGTGWDELTVSKRRRKTRPARRNAATRVKASVSPEPTVSLLAKVNQKRAEWEAATPGPDKQKILSELRLLEIRAGIRDRSGKSIELDYMGETWASKQD